MDEHQKDAATRSVDNLQRLFTVVVGLALTEILRRLLQPGDLNLIEITQVIAFIVTLIPFYHGANRYLDDAYVVELRKASHIGLMVDFLVLFSEGVVLFVDAELLNSFKGFYTLFSILLLLDIVWVFSTHLTSSDPSGRGPTFRKWGILNAIAAALIAVFVWSTIPIWVDRNVTAVAIMFVAIVRSACDYWLLWDFYYPHETGNATRENR